MSSSVPGKAGREVYIQHPSLEREWLLQRAIDSLPEAEHIAVACRLRALAKVKGHSGPSPRPIVPSLPGAVQAVEPPALAEEVLVFAERGDGGLDVDAAPLELRTAWRILVCAS